MFVKIPRFAFEKFPSAEPLLGVSMKSVGETMAIGRNFKEALQKAFRGLETGLHGLENSSIENLESEQLEKQLQLTSIHRLFYIKMALAKGLSIHRVAELSSIDPWFIDNVHQILILEQQIKDASRDLPLNSDILRMAKTYGFSDQQISDLRENIDTPSDIRMQRKQHHIDPIYHLVDTCAGEFEAYTPYYYSCYGSGDESISSTRKKVMVLGSGPNRIGQGIEFDYCCVHTVKALRELGYESIMVNSNPETVSTDYDTSDKLYFEPLTFEDVMNIYEKENPEGIIVQMGGQTPLKLSVPLMKAGVRILGTSPENIDRAEDRKRCKSLLDALNLRQPESETANDVKSAVEVAHQIGLPVMIRPSYVLGGRAMMVAYTNEEVKTFVQAALAASPGFPVLIDRFLEQAVEVDVDIISDGKDVFVGGVMQHVEQAGVHSGDSACATPPYSISNAIIQHIVDACTAMAVSLEVKGLMNVQIAVKDDQLFVLEINPRASRTIPYISKATGVPLAKIATQVIMGKKLKELDLPTPKRSINWCAVKEAVFPFDRFAGVDPTLGPEMKSTGEVMGIDHCFELAYWKSQIAAGQILPTEGTVFLSARDSDKSWILELSKELLALGFEIAATKGTAESLNTIGIEAKILHKLAEQTHPNVLDCMKNDEICLLINTPSGPKSRVDEVRIRSEAILRSIPIVTTESGARATLASIRYMRNNSWDVKALQDYLEPE